MSSTPVFHLFFTGAGLGVRGGSGGAPSKRLLHRGAQPGSGVDSGALVGRTTGVRSQRWSLVRIPRCLGHYSGVTFYRRRPHVPPTELSRPTRSGSSRRSGTIAFFSRTHAPQPGGLPHARMPLLIPAASPATSRTMMTQLTFVLLQLADVVTTMLALGSGGHEQNPLVARFMVIGTLQGLILSKVVLLAAAAAALRFRRFRAIRMANVVFGVIVLWNISVIIRLAWRSHSP